MYSDRSPSPVKSLQISPFSRVNLRELGIYLIALIKFDIVIGPEAWVSELMKGSKLMKQLENPVSLSEMYTGYARSDVEVLELVNEKVAIARYMGEDENSTATPSLLLISFLKHGNVGYIRYLAKYTLSKSKADPTKLDEALRETIRELDAMKSSTLEVNEEKYSVDFNTVITRGDEFDSVYGFILIDTKFKKIDARFISKWIGTVKLDPQELTEYVLHQMSNFSKKEELITVFYRGTELFIVRPRHLAFNYLMITAKKAKKVINVDALTYWVKHLLHIVSEDTKVLNNEKMMMRGLTFIAEQIRQENGEYRPKYIGRELLNIILEAHRLLPDLTVSPTLVQVFEMPLFSQERAKYKHIILEFNGKRSLLEIAEERNLPLLELAEEVLFCVSREILVLLRGKR